jgi:hypothetical protein
MVASFLESLALGVVVLAGLFCAVALTGCYFLWRNVRRRMRAFRSHGAVIGAAALWESAASNRWNRTAVPATAAEVAGWSSTRVRKELWRSVDRAATAVRTADSVGAPTAELPSLCRRLQAAATDIDKVLRVDPAAPVPAALHAQVGEVMRAADDVQQAAVASAGEAGSQRIRELTEDAGNEVALLDAGLATLRSTVLPQLPQ